MHYEYSGYLKTILDAPDPDIREQLESVVFKVDDLMRWSVEETEQRREWEHIPVQRTRQENAVRIEGRFENIRRLDIQTAEPRFWVSLTANAKNDDRFPVDVVRYPIVEVTYRCSNPTTRPALLWRYPGGVHFASLAFAGESRTMAREVPHFGFPRQVEGLSFRLYSTTRTAEWMEIEAVRFRAMSAREAEALRQNVERIEAERPPERHYPVLDHFFPLGTFMNARTAKQSAEMLDLSFDEYWWLALEDIAKHHHNCIALENAEVLSGAEMESLLTQGRTFHVKFVPMNEFPLDRPLEENRAFVDTHIAPHKDSAEILAWNIYAPPAERLFPRLMEVKPLIEEADPNHPVAMFAQYPNAFALFARYFAVTGIAHYASHAPWTVTETLRQHLPLSRGRQFWLIAPGFVFPSDTPDWNGCPEMRLMMNLAFACGVKGWFSYAFHGLPGWITGSCQRSLTGSFLAFSDLWAELGHRMHRTNAVTPLLLHTEPAQELEPWFRSTSSRHARSQLPEHIAPTAVYRLQGSDYNVYGVVSNDFTEMASEHIVIDPEHTRGLALFDVTDFVRYRTWHPMPLTRDIEMFPGQAHMIIAAELHVCEYWRDVVASRLIEEDRRQLGIDIALTRLYDADLGPIDALLDETGQGNLLDDLVKTKRARDRLLDLMYDTPAICHARSGLIEASAALAGCDIALCALLGRGKVDEAEDLGKKVIPLAKRLARLRIELRQGRGADIVAHCEALGKRSAQVLAEIRARS